MRQEIDRGRLGRKVEPSFFGRHSGCLLVVDPANTRRFIQIRGLAELIEEGAIENLDRLTRKYPSHPCSYGHIYPVEERALETQVVCRIRANRITLDATHA